MLLDSLADDRRPRNKLGIAISEATDPELQYDWEAGLPTTDFAAKKLAEAKTAYEKAYPDADMSSLLWRVERRSASSED